MDGCHPFGPLVGAVKDDCESATFQVAQLMAENAVWSNKTGALTNLQVGELNGKEADSAGKDSCAT